MIVVDASVLLAAIVDAGGSGALARRALQLDDSRHAPGLLDVEVTSSLRRLTQSGQVSPRTALDMLAELAAYPITRHPERLLMAAAFELRDNVTAYDATYVVLAGLLGAELVTSDARLARAPGLPCTVRLLSA